MLRGTLAARFPTRSAGSRRSARDVAERLLPLVEDTGWFFDTELLVLAERPGCASTRCRWTGSTTRTAGSTSWPPRVADLRGIARLGRALATGRLPLRDRAPQLGRAAARAAGRACRRRWPASWCGSPRSASPAPLAYLAAVPRCCARGLGAQAANLVALLLTAVANTAANRRLTFGVRGRRTAPRHQLQGLVVFALGLGLTSGSLALLHADRPTRPGRWRWACWCWRTCAATLLRFVLLRRWVFHRPPDGDESPALVVHLELQVRDRHVETPEP